MSPPGCAYRPWPERGFFLHGSKAITNTELLGCSLGFIFTPAVRVPFIAELFVGASRGRFDSLERRERLAKLKCPDEKKLSGGLV